MKITKIIQLQIQNFKGIANGTFDFNGENTNIIADIMQGKSTLKESYLWCLGVDIDNFYPVNKNNKLIDGLETRITMLLNVDNIEYSLSRSAKAKYKNNAFDGYKKDMFEFDGVPCNSTEYKTKTCNLLGVNDFDTLKYLSILNYFNEEVNWKERRNLLYHLFVDKKTIDNLKNNEKYNLISTELKKGKLSGDINAMLNSENKRLQENKRKNEILLADKQSELSNYSNIDYSKIENELATVENEIKQEEEKLNAINNESNKTAILSQIYELTKEKVKLEEEKIRTEGTLSESLFKIKRELELLKNEGERLESQIKSLTQQYNELKVAEFDEKSTVCPTCHQSLPQARVDELKIAWANNRDNRLNSLKATILPLKQQYVDTTEKYVDKQAQYTLKKAEIDGCSFPRLAEVEKELTQLKQELENIKSKRADSSCIEELKAKRNFLMEELGKKYGLENLNARIDALIKEQKQLANVEIELTKKRNQLEQYTLDVISLINSSINNNFNGVNFKLFKELTATSEKGIAETCIATHNGIEYESCSTGEKAISNCIIISTLQNSLGVNLPIWLDDASILNLKNEPNNQLIYLLNEKGKKLECTRIDEIY